MTEVTCRRCGQRNPGLEQPPLPGAWGEAILAETCARCWRDWSEEQTRLINHLGLRPYLPADKKTLYGHLHQFLKLTGVPAPDA
jgi:Fe-S cluster biosynthesis and repair protein YggX